MHVRDPQYSKALEVVAGGRLYQVVVDSAETGKSLLASGSLKRRVTILPLDTISASPLSQQQQNGASRVSNNRALTAVSLVTFEPSVEKAMQYVFGRTFVCQNLDMARAVAFDPQVQVRTVTLDGDIFDPSGTLTGGSDGSSKGSRDASLVDLVFERDSLQQEIDVLRKELAVVSDNKDKIIRMQEKAGKVSSLKAEADSLERAIASHAYHRLKSDIESAETEAVQLQRQMAILEADLKEKQALLDSMTSASKQSGDSLKKALSQANSDLTSYKKKKSECAQQLATVHAELAQLHKEIERSTASGSELRDSVDGLRPRLAAKQTELQELRSKVFECKKQEDAKRSEVSASSSAISELEREIESLTTSVNESSLFVRKAEHERSRITKDTSGAVRERDARLRKNSGIEADARSLSVEDMNLEALRGRIKDLEDRCERLGRSVNKKVIHMLDSTEKDYQELLEKREKVVRDREKIEQVMVTLDVKKREALEDTWTKVNKDFGSILNTLLPGMTAKLDRASEDDLAEGLQIRVALGGTWKESLTELSGGQRSLVALSLILAMLRYKPAPVYILDEVDAALDLSHTQNIGQMLKTYFKEAQFVIVSLKEGMFNNANVLFRTNNVNGQSSVQRISNVRS
nr:structural maintenance of chromosomes protein 2 [Andalucia godoyi]